MAFFDLDIFNWLAWITDRQSIGGNIFCYDRTCSNNGIISYGNSGEDSHIATNPTIDGDVTALYIQRALSGTNVKISRLASGLPVGGDLEYADKLTLARSFSKRQSL